MLFSILLERIAIMALLMAVGVYLSRKGFLSEQGSRDLGAILLRIIIPCVIIKSYITEYSHQRLLELGLSALLALISYVVAMLLSYLVFGQRRRLDEILPLLSAMPASSAFPWCRPWWDRRASFTSPPLWPC